MQHQPYPQITPLDDPDYPSSDGKPMSDNTKQFDWIVAIQGGVNAIFRDDPNVWVAGDCLWYPVEGNPKIRVAPDTMVVFGRPRGYRGSYIQHREEGITPQVVFEVLSPGNRAGEMRRKLGFYETYGVEEYYILDPDFRRHKGYVRDESGKLAPIAELFGWISPRLNVRFEMTDELRIFYPDGRLIEFYETLALQRALWESQAEQERLRADENELEVEQERLRADRSQRHADQAKRRANEATLRADQERLRADQERLRAEQERVRAERLLAQLRALGIEPDA